MITSGIGPHKVIVGKPRKPEPLSFAGKLGTPTEVNQRARRIQSVRGNIGSFKTTARKR